MLQGNTVGLGGLRGVPTPLMQIAGRQKLPDLRRALIQIQKGGAGRPMIATSLVDYCNRI